LNPGTLELQASDLEMFELLLLSSREIPAAPAQAQQ
jgi:hypothetical protein